MKNSINKIAARAQLGTSLAAIAAASACLFSTAAYAQTADSTLRGRAPAGAELVVKEVNTGSVRRTTVSADGTYVVVGLQPGNYHVTAGDLSGDVILTVASTSVLNLEAPAEGSADIVVKGTRSTVDTHSSEVNQFVSLHDIAVIPQTTRNFLEFADTVPGVQFSVDNQGNTSLRGGAQLASAVNVYIDGVSQKDYVGGGSGITGSAGPNGTGDPGNPFPQLAIGEYKVITSNYSAQYGDASSAIILAQTKSGTNQFHGEAFGEFTNQDLRSKTPAEKASGSDKARVPSWQYGAALGGPIIKDVAHFFFTWEHKSLSNQNVVAPQSITVAQAQSLLPAELASQYGPVTNPFTENLYFGKIDIEPTSKDRIELSGKLRLEDTVTGSGGTAAASAASPYVNNDRRADVRWQHNEDTWSNQIRVSYQNTNSATTTTSASPQSQYKYFPLANSTDQSSMLLITGGPGSGVGAINRQKGYTFADDFTLPNVHLAGDHTFHAGFSYGSIKLKTQNASSDLANATYYYAVTPSGLPANPIPYEVQFPVINAGISAPSVTTTDKQYSAYVQDDWQVNNHLTLNLGVRWDHEVVPAYLDFVTPANVVSAINGLFPGTTQSYASVLAQGYGSMPGFDINDYISNGKNRKAPNNFSPRIGFSYDVNGDGRHVIFGGYARAYNRNQFSTLALEVTKIALNNNPEVYFPSPYTQNAFGPCADGNDVNPDNHCYQWDNSYLTPAGLASLPISSSSGEADLLHNNIKTPYSDQFSLGMRNQIGEWNTQATLSYVASYDGIIGRLGNRYANGAYFQNGSQWGAQGVPGVGGLILWDNGAKDRLLQFSLGAQKAYTKASGWGATISYTYSASDQNNLAGGTNPYQIANNQYLFDLPYASDYPFVDGTAAPTHRLVATYSRDMFWGMTFATKIELSTPPHATAIFGCTSVCNAQGGTTTFVSRAPKQFLGYKDIDAQLSKDITFFRGISGSVRLDVLNVFNWHNYDPASILYPSGPNGEASNAGTTPVFNKDGNIVGVPRTLKVSVGLKF